jgi:hypothetical protein
LPIQHSTICQLVIDVVRTCALELSDPIAYQQRRRNGYCDVNVVLSAADFMEDETLRL